MPESDTSSKIALVTGGTSGVGLALLRHLYRNGYQVLFVGRNAQRGKEIEAEYKDQGPGAVRFVQQDLGDLSGVRKMARELAQELPRLDLLANVAGLVLPQRRTTKEGIEMTFAVGYLSAWILCEEFEALLKASAPARIINVSGSEKRVLKEQVDFDDIFLEQKYSGIKAAFAAISSKMVLTQVWAEKLRPHQVVVNAFHPGIVKSNLTRNFAPPLRWIGEMGQVFLANESTTANAMATDSPWERETGQLLVRKKKYPIAFREAYVNRLVEHTARILTGIKD